MGIHDREYFRDDSTGNFSSPVRSGGVQSWPVWKKIIAITVAVFIVQLVVPSATDWLSLSINSMQKGYIWTLLTYAFAHNERDILHIIFNMALLYFFGRRLESMYGAKEFALMYCASAIFAGFIILLLGFYFQAFISTIGASGAALALLMLYAMHFPREKVFLFGAIPIEIRWLMLGVLAYDLFPVLRQFGGNNPTDNISHAGHLGGALFGYLYFRFRIRLKRLTNFFPLNKLFSLRGQKSKLKIYREEPQEVLESEVDRILQKINEQGEASLTNKERKALQNASKRYKNKNS